MRQTIRFALLWLLVSLAGCGTPLLQPSHAQTSSQTMGQLRGQQVNMPSPLLPGQFYLARPNGMTAGMFAGLYAGYDGTGNELLIDLTYGPPVTPHRSVLTSNGLSGGGNLSADLTLGLYGYASATTGYLPTKGSGGTLTWIPVPATSGGGSGTVTSVALSMPAVFSVSGSPITTSGTLGVSLLTQSANLVWASPTSGGAAAPTFRNLVAADIPGLPTTAITSGVFGTSFLGTGSASSSTYLRGDGTWQTPPNSGGTVTNFSATVPSWMTASVSNPSTTPALTLASATGLAANSFLRTPNGSAGSLSIGPLISADIPALNYVTSVGLSVPGIFGVTGSPVTSSGTLGVSLLTQSANFVWAGPASGSAAAPTFRNLVATDIPGLPTTAIISGVFGTSFLGTGTASSSTYLRGDGTWATVTGGSASPGGSSGQVQYNNAGAFAGDSGLTYSSSSALLSIGASAGSSGTYTPALKLVNAPGSGSAGQGTGIDFFTSSPLVASHPNISIRAIYDGSTTNLLFLQSTTELARIEHGGGVRIGTTSSFGHGELLSVNGTICPTGYLASDGSAGASGTSAAGDTVKNGLVTALGTSTTANFADGEEVFGANGSITDFTLAHSVIAGSAHVFMGTSTTALYRLYPGIVSASGTNLHFLSAPPSGSYIVVDYRY